MKFTITKSGKYKTRDGRVVEIEFGKALYWRGMLDNDVVYWSHSGSFGDEYIDHPNDIVEGPLEVQLPYVRVGVDEFIDSSGKLWLVVGCSQSGVYLEGVYDTTETFVQWDIFLQDYKL